MESGILGFGHQEYSSRNRETHLTIEIRNPSSNDKKSVTLNPELSMWNAKSKAVSDRFSLYRVIHGLKKQLHL